MRHRGEHRQLRQRRTDQRSRCGHLVRWTRDARRCWGAAGSLWAYLRPRPEAGELVRDCRNGAGSNSVLPKGPVLGLNGYDGTQVGSGDLVGSIIKGEIYINLNPNISDSNVNLSGTIEGIRFHGTWSFNGYAGALNQGTLAATARAKAPQG